MSEVEIKKTVFDVFVDGAKKGWGVAVGSIIPNVLMAFVITQFLNVLGILKWMGDHLGGLMSIFGLPGEGLAVLLAGWLSMGGGTGMAASMYANGVFEVKHLAIMLPAIYMMGSQVQYMGRILGTGGIKPRYYGIMILFSILNAVIAMFAMRIITPMFI